MSETELQSEVLRLAKQYGWRTFHARQGRAAWHIGSGFPDLTMVRGRRLLFAELKREREGLEPKQEQWRDELMAVSGSINHYTWRPSDLREGHIEDLLR